MKIIYTIGIVFITVLILFGCSSNEASIDFQTSDQTAPFDLYHLFDSYPSLKFAWDSVPGNIGNQKLTQMMQDDIPGTTEFFSILTFLMDKANAPGLGLLGDLKEVTRVLTDVNPRFYANSNIGSFYAQETPASLNNDFYGFLDEITNKVGGTAPPVHKSVTGIINKILPYLLAKSDSDLQRYIEELYMPTFYPNVNFVGTGIRLKAGSYTRAQLSAAGMADNSLSSLKVPLGFKVFLYQNDNFGGASWVIDSSSPDLSLEGCGDQTSSLVIAKDPGDMTDLAELLAQPTAMADYPMWLNQGASPGQDSLITDYGSMSSSGTNSNLGNMAQGMESLVSGLIGIINGETVDRPFFYDLFSRLNTAITNTGMIKRLLWNLSNYFTPNGYVYGTLNTANTDVTENIYNTDSDGIYSNVELSETFRQLLAGASGLFLRDDRRGSLAWHDGITSEDYPLADTLKHAKKIYINWDKAQIKESMYDLIRFDALGRDRRTDSSAYSANMLEHLLYLSAGALNAGFLRKEDTAELHNPGDLNTPEANANRNGHGAFTGYATLNDTLFAMMSGRDALSSMGMYELGFDSDGVNTGKTQVYRSRKPFTESDKSKYLFKFSWNYPSLNLLSGACAGDYGVGSWGSLNGGNNNGIPLDVDQYIPYTGNGVHTKDLSSFLLSWEIRGCWEGEGPYYSTQGATQNGSNYTYYRPDGSIYAVVNKSGSQWTYTYPVSAPYDAADPDDPTQRYNRYKAAWDTDYYTMNALRDNSGTYFVPTDSNNDTKPDSTGNTVSPACRTYRELYPEPIAAALGPKRECASYEEAIFRNFQWVMTEKKFAIVVPFWLYGNACGFMPVSSAVYLIIEGNGIAGIAASRRYRGNGVWAKLNAGDTGDNSVQSTIPGDYRIIALARPVDTALGLGTVNADKILDLMGRGTALFATGSQCLIAISRFAFPRSATITSDTNYTHNLLGSRKVTNSDDTDVGFQTTDNVWKKRNSLIPLFMALLAPARERSWYNSPSDNYNALAVVLEGLSALVNPFMFFNYNSDGSGVAQNCWLSRLQGGAMTNAYVKEHSKSLMPDCEIAGFVKSTTDPTGWYGGDSARNFYAPPSIPTMLSVLCDSDTSQDRSNKNQRADGLLSQLCTYDVTQGIGRPAVTETLVTPAAPDITNINKICFGLEQLTTGMKGSKSKATHIYENMSNGTISTTKQLDPPEWMFQKRLRPDDPAKYIDMDLDKLFKKLKGGDTGTDMTKGLNQFHDDNGTYNDGKPNYNNLTNADENGIVDILQTLTSDFLVQNAPYCISENLFDIMDVMSQHTLTPAQVKGLIYTLGKIMAYYDGSTWLLQGEDPSFSALYDLLTNVLPTMDMDMGIYSAEKGQTKGETYRALLHSTQEAMADNGLVLFILDSVSIGAYSSGDLLTELSQWLNSNLISGADTDFYSTMAEILQKLADIVQAAPTEEMLYSIYDQYGFQANN